MPRAYWRLRLSPAEIERAAGALFRAGTLGGWEDETSSTYFAAFGDAASARTALELLRADGIVARIEENVEAPDPFAAHRASLAPFSVGRFRIDPRGEPDGGTEGEKTLWIPAHGAFGTGLHESTRGILRWIDANDVAGRRVIDIGCGSAILAIAADRRGAALAVAFDVDADAIFEARRNLVRNRAGRVRLFAGTIAAAGGTFDLAFANMIWEESGPLVPDVARRLRSGGGAIFAGILDARAEEAAAGIAAADLTIAFVEPDGEWRTIVARKGK